MEELPSNRILRSSLRFRSPYVNTVGIRAALVSPGHLMQAESEPSDLLCPLVRTDHESDRPAFYWRHRAGNQRLRRSTHQLGKTTDGDKTRDFRLQSFRASELGSYHYHETLVPELS
jgi:hypothetical protein